MSNVVSVEQEFNLYKKYITEHANTPQHVVDLGQELYVYNVIGPQRAFGVVLTKEKEFIRFIPEFKFS